MSFVNKREVPKWPAGRYRLTQESYIGRIPGADHERLPPGSEIVWDGLPGPHMEPIDAQAHANVEHAMRTVGQQTLDPTTELSLILGEDTDLTAMEAQLAAQLAAVRARKAGVLATQGPSPGSIPPPAPLAAAQAAPAATAADLPAVPVAALPGLPPPLHIPPPPTLR